MKWVTGPVFQTRTLRLIELKSQSVSNVTWDLNPGQADSRAPCLNAADSDWEQEVARATHTKVVVEASMVDRGGERRQTASPHRAHSWLRARHSQAGSLPGGQLGAATSIRTRASIQARRGCVGAKGGGQVSQEPRNPSLE